eukprot:m.66616 g.66616  ORF g.66616 m.66616 type:complete len:264 (-) comp23710_c0_seq2:1348-2139(-)
MAANLHVPWFRIPTQEVLLGPAPIDWCESNHASSNPFSVEEFHNTWTNVAYIVVGALLYRHMSLERSTDPLFAFFCAFVILTGVTSGWFHATLIFAAQKSDEFFENAAVLALMYYNINLPSNCNSKNDDVNATSDSHRRLCLVLVAHTMVMGIGVFCIPEVFCEAHLICTVLVCFRYGLARVETIKCERTKATISNLFHRSFVSAGIGFSFWIVDFAFCSERVRLLHLHAYAWHFLTVRTCQQQVYLFHKNDPTMCSKEECVP